MGAWQLYLCALEAAPDRSLNQAGGVGAGGTEGEGTVPREVYTQDKNIRSSKHCPAAGKTHLPFQSPLGRSSAEST